MNVVMSLFFFVMIHGNPSATSVSIRRMWSLLSSHQVHSFLVGCVQQCKSVKPVIIGFASLGGPNQQITCVMSISGDMSRRKLIEQQKNKFFHTPLHFHYKMRGLVFLIFMSFRGQCTTPPCQSRGGMFFRLQGEGPNQGPTQKLMLKLEPIGCFLCHP